MKSKLSQKINSMSLLSRMLVISTVILALVMGIVFASVVYDEAAEIKTHHNQTVNTQLNTISTAIKESVSEKNYELTQKILNEYTNFPEIDSIVYTNTDGTKIDIKNKTTEYKNYPDFFADLLALKSISYKTALTNQGTLEVKTSVVNSTNNIWYRVVKGFLLFIVIIALNMLAIWQIMRLRLLPSLRAIEENALKLSTLNSDIRIKEVGAPELRNTIAAFNKMAMAIKTDRETLKKTLEMQNAFFENNAAGFLLVSSNRTILMINRQFQEIFGYTKEDILGKNARMIHINDETYHGWAPSFQTAKNGMAVSNAEYEFKRKDGRPIWCSFYGSKIELGDGEVGVLWSMIDIDERKNAEKRLRRLNVELETKVQNETAARLEQERILMQQSRMAAMGEMIGAIAHQWRQPLNTLGIIIQDLKYMYKDGELTKESLEDTVKRSMNIIKFMSKTIDDFRGFFKADKHSATIGVMEKVRHSSELLSAQLSAHWITLVIEGDEKIKIKCLANEFEQVILNIIGNAKDALIANNIKEPLIKINVSRQNESVLITVSDNGGGIGEDVIDKIFDPYFTTKGPDKGTGMGLYMSKIIVERHMGGKLNAANDENGAILTIELPV